MIRSYFVIGLRHLRKHLGYTVVNVLGLTIGIACCLLMALYVQHEVSHDRFHENAGRIVRVVQTLNYGGGEVRSAMTSPLLGPALASTYPAVEHAVRLDSESAVVSGVDGQRFREEVVFADPAFFDVFSFGLSEGRGSHVLADPTSAVLSAEAARRIFGDAEPIGQPLSIRLLGKMLDFRVAAVLDPLPTASSLQLDVLLPFDRLEDVTSGLGQNWGTLSGPTYLLLKSVGDRNALSAALADFVASHLPSNRANRKYELQPLTKVHLDPDVESGIAATSDPAYVYLLALLAGSVLILACINFTMLALGRSVTRAREVGIRKVIGAMRPQIMKQFWGEALVIAFLSLAAGLLLLQAVLPAFNEFSGKSLSVAWDPLWLVLMVVVLIGVSLLAGSYPAVFLSRFNPVSVLKGDVSVGGRHRLTQALVVIQFAVSIFLLIGSLFMSKQLDLLTERNLGFDDDQLVRIRTNYGDTWEGRRLLERLDQRLASESSIQGLSGSMFAFGDPDGQRNVFRLAAGTDTVGGHLLNVTPGFVETFGVDLVRGRNFSEDRAADKGGAVLVNESLAEAFGWDDPIGKRLSANFGLSDAVVIGVVRDFHYESLHERVDPIVMHVGVDPVWSLYARVAPGRALEAVGVPERAWHEVVPDLPFELEFVDQAIDRVYRAEMQWAWLIRAGSGVAVFIACLGLLGLAALAAARRRRELSIRKVLGASAEQLVLLLTGRFVVLVLIGLAIAAPIGYVAVNRWLDNFAYQVDVTADVFLVAGLLAVTIAALTVSTQALRAAWSDPAEALKSE